VSNAPQPAQAGPVILEAKHDGIATLVMNRPDRLNALNNELAMAVNDALGRIAEDPSVNVVVITGAGRAFCAGGDLGALGKGHQTGATHELEPLLRAGMQMVLKMRTMPQPVIAAVNGAAAGAGMNIALAADIRIAAEEATFGQNFAKVGLFPDYGGTYFLPQLVGPAKAAELFYTGDMIDAKTALALASSIRSFPPRTGNGCEGISGKDRARAVDAHSRGEEGAFCQRGKGTCAGARQRSPGTDSVLPVR